MKVVIQTIKEVIVFGNFLVTLEIYSYAFAFTRFEAMHQKLWVVIPAMREKSEDLTTVSKLQSVRVDVIG